MFMDFDGDQLIKIFIIRNDFKICTCVIACASQVKPYWVTTESSLIVVSKITWSGPSIVFLHERITFELDPSSPSLY